MAMYQGLQQKLQQKLSPQQIQLMKLLQVPTALLEERLKEEIEDNPALEMGEEVSEDQEKESADDLDDIGDAAEEELASEGEDELYTDYGDEDDVDVS